MTTMSEATLNQGHRVALPHSGLIYAIVNICYS